MEMFPYRNDQEEYKGELEFDPFEEVKKEEEPTEKRWFPLSKKVEDKLYWQCPDCGKVIGHDDQELVYHECTSKECTSKDEFLIRYDKRCKELRDVLEAKGSDYSGDIDRHANFKLITHITQDRPMVMNAVISCLIRQLDKIQRAINLFINDKAEVSSESMTDTLKDNIGYAHIAADIWEEMKKEDETKDD